MYKSDVHKKKLRIVRDCLDIFMGVFKPRFLQKLKEQYPGESAWQEKFLELVHTHRCDDGTLRKPEESDPLVWLNVIIRWYQDAKAKNHEVWDMKFLSMFHILRNFRHRCQHFENLDYKDVYRCVDATLQLCEGVEDKEGAKDAEKIRRYVVKKMFEEIAVSEQKVIGKPSTNIPVSTIPVMQTNPPNQQYQSIFGSDVPTNPQQGWNSFSNPQSSNFFNGDKSQPLFASNNGFPSNNSGNFFNEQKVGQFFNGNNGQSDDSNQWPSANWNTNNNNQPFNQW